MIGQLYLVKTRGRMKEDNSIEYCTYILAAQNKDEVEMKISYFVDKAEYNEFAITGLERIKPNFHVVHRNIVEAEAYFASKEVETQMKQEAKEAKADESPTLQKKRKNIFAFGFVGHVIGRDEKHALLKLSNYLVKKSMGSNATLPFVANGHFVMDELGEADSTRVSNLTKNDPQLFQGGRLVVRGGGCSPR